MSVRALIAALAAGFAVSLGLAVGDAASPAYAQTAGSAVSFGLAVGNALSPAYAQTFPSKPIRFIIPYPPGGPRDMQARLLAPKLNEVWGQQIVIDNRAGASGMIGMELAARAYPDGYTVVMISSSYTTAPSLYAKLPYDTFGDFVAVAPLTSGPGLLVVNNALPVKSVKDLIAVAKSRPGQLNFGSAGNGVPSHLSMELFKLMTGTELTHVPYKGMAAALNDVISGQIQVSLPTIPGALPHVQAGRVRALGVSGARRSPAAPDIPTIAEAGIPGYESTNWYGVSVPARTPRSIIVKMNAEIGRIIMSPDVKAKLLTIGMESETSSPEQFDAFLHNEVGKWAKVIKATGLKIE